MSGNSASISLLRLDPISRKTLRYALGMVVMFAVVFTYNWPAAFLVILIGNGFLLGSKPTLKSAFEYVYKMTLAWLIAVLISYLFLDYYIIYLLVIGLIMLHIYYADSSVLSPLLKVFMCIMNMLVPLMSLKSPALGATLGSLLLIGSIGALLLSSVLFALIPDIEVPADQATAAPAPPAPKPSKQERFGLAIRSLAVLFPLLLLFFFFNMQSDVLILVYISLFAAMPGFAKDLSIGKMMVRTTLIGGLVAFFMYEILVIIPMFSFFMLMVFGLALFAGYQLFTSGKYAITIKKGWSAIIFIFGGAANSIDVDLEGKVLTRTAQMVFLVIYLVVAFKILEKFFPQTKKSN